MEPDLFACPVLQAFEPRHYLGLQGVARPEVQPQVRAG